MARHRLFYLESLLPSSRETMDRELDRAISFVTVELLNTWANFSRSMYFSVCLGTRDTSGGRVTTQTAFTDFHHAQHHAAQLFKPKTQLVPGRISHREEPNWLEPNILQKLLSDIGASNEQVVIGALSVPTRAFKDLPSIRNFYAHRCQNTAEKAANIGRNYGAGASLHPTQLCLSYAPNRPQSILRDWIFDVRSVMQVAVI